jgi:uncharacterized membrane protein YidH (DUF202 family)
VYGGSVLQYLSRHARINAAPKRKNNAMNREQWMWMRASVALVAAAAAAMRFNAAAESVPALPQPLAGE